ncbi:MAG: hypothetical protein BGP01_12815 [Paludibacter sp. 47-17]|nr:MAG: hypothetical protein BGP01_12815 [Paludibacter sp. 47-17]
MSAELSQFGNISYKRSLRASRIAVRIQPDGLVITLPVTKSQAEATAFVLSIRERILMKQNRIRQRSQNSILTEEKGYKTLSFDVHLSKANRKDVFFQFQEGKLHIEYPLEADLSSEKVQQACWKGIQYFMKKEARRLLPARVEQLARHHGFNFKDVKIQSGKTRWGSCSSQKNINLSFYLMILSPELVDYVILHELCHTVEMNHGDRFWKLMDKVTEGKTEKYRRELKKYHIPE